MANNDTGSLSYSLNIDTSQISKEIRNVEKQLSTISMIADMSVNTDAEQIIEAIKTALMAEDFKLKVTLDDSFNKTINQAFSIADSAASGALEGALSKGLKGGIAGFAVNGVMALIGAYIEYSNEQERIQIETAKTIEGIDLQQQNVNGLFSELTNLNNSTADNNTTTSERIRLLNELAEIEPALAESIRQQTHDQDALNAAIQQYNTLAEFKSFSLFLANEDKGFLSDNLIQTLNGLGEVENKLKIAELKVQKTYDKAYEVFKGGVNGKYGKDLQGLSDSALQQIEQIFAAKESEAKKLENLSTILYRDTQGYDSVGLSELYTQKKLINIIGGSLKDDTLVQFNGVSNDFENEKKKAEQTIQEFSDNITAHMAAKGQDMKQGEEGIKQYIRAWDELGKYGQDSIILKLGYSLDVPKVTELSQWQREIKDILGDSISINVNTTMPQVIADIRSKYAVLKQSMESLEPIYIKAKYNLENNIPLDTIILAGYKQYTANEEVANKYKNAAATMQTDLEPPKVTPPKIPAGPKKDNILETYKEQIELIKKLSSVYKQNKEIWDDDTALEKTFESYKVLLDGLKLTKKDIADPTKLYKRIQDEVADNKDRSKAINPSVLDEFQYVMQEEQRAKWTTLNKEIEKAQKAYELYESLRNKIGDDKAKEFVKADTGVEISADSFKDYATGMIDANNTMSEKMSNDLKEKYAAKTKETLTSLLQDFQTADDKLNAINTKYDKYKADLDANKANMDPSRYDATNKLISEGKQKEISGLSDGLLEKTSTYKSLFEEATKASEKEITFLIEKFKTAIAEATSKGKDADGLLHLNIDGKEIVRTEAQVDDFVEELDKKEKKIIEKNPFKALGKSIQDLSKNLNSSQKIKNDIKALEESLKTAPSEETKGINEKIDLLKGNLKGVDAQNATTWANMSTQITSVTKQATDLGGAFVSLFSSLFPEDTDTAGTMTDIIGIVGGVGEAGAGIARIASGDVIGGLTQGIKGVASVVSSITSLGDRKHEKEIRRLQKAIDESKIAYEDLGRTATKAFGDASYNARKLQIAQLKLQQTLLQQQIKEEQDKKKTDKDKVKQLEEQYRQLGIQIEDGLGSILESMLGGNIKSFAGQLSDALLDAFMKGEDAAEGYRSKVKDVIGDIMRSIIKQRLIEDVLGKTIDKYVSKWVDTEGNLTKSPEEMLKDMVLMGTELESKGDVLAKMLENLPDDVKKYFQKEAESQQLSGLSKGVQGMTQDTAMILEAYMNTIRDVVISIMMSNENQLSILQTSQMIQSQILTEVSAINSNTVALNRAFQSVITQSGGDNGAGIRVYVK